MISVPNLRQQLSGSKIVLFVLLFLPLLSSCELFEKAQSSSDKPKTGEELDPIQGRKVFDQETGTYVIIEEAITEKMDTITWRDVPPGSDPPITSDGVAVDQGNRTDIIRVDQFGSEILTSYNVAVVLPFLSDRFNETSSQIYQNSSWALNFYGGMELAMDELDSEGVKLNVNVLDSKASGSTVNSLLRSNAEMKNAHLIIGPYRRDYVRQVAEFAKSEDKAFVSPHSASGKLSSRNPNYVQVNPTLQSHCEAITRHVLKNYRPDQVVLVARDNQSEIDRFGHFHREVDRHISRSDTSRFQEFIIADNSVDLGKIDMLPFISLQDTAIFIVPSWSNETFIYSFLQKLDLAKGEDTHVVVYGMPQWMTFERVDFSYYEKLNVHVSSSSYLDPLSPEVQLFKRRFYERYGAIPTPEAFEGYDVMLYFGRMINKYGTKFQYSIDAEMYQTLHTRFEFGQVVIPVTTGRENLPIEQFENKYVNILTFKNFQFQLAD